ncbi:hypothetical protein AD953_15315 [Acetobacter malorum]|uniref:HTH lysR-type domain-containing protein n=1 Tax=Acetobacter malorum TaxID=178901 RepID=A0A149V0E1_9PROT|nr:LysR family substrate-binding domain-containing protein [Acetobacter malorum]KXV73622.1 hypothetical protein AD953_15315 [Acetobacter malorum]
MFSQHGRSHIDQDELFRKIIRGHISLASMVEAIAVAEYKNFRKASRALKISQSSVSSRISSLEISIGYKIFDRQNGINVTIKGKHFLSIVGEALALIGEAVQPNPEVSHVVERQLSLGIQSCSAGGFLNNLLNLYSDTFQETRLVSGEFAPDSLVPALRRREIDIAFSPEVPSPRTLAHDILHIKALWTENMVVALSSDDPIARLPAITWEALAKHIFLVRREGMGAWLMAQSMRYFEEKGLVPQIERLRIGRDTMLTDVNRRKAAAFTSEASAAVKIPRVCLRPIDGNPISLTFYAIWSRQNHNPALRDFLNMIEKMDYSSASGAIEETSDRRE